MYAVVRLRLFSGLDNPEWRLEGKEAVDLYQRIGSLRSIQAEQWKQPFPRLGYRGIEVTLIEKDKVMAHVVFHASGAVDQLTGALLEDEARAVERLLFGTAPRAALRLGQAPVDTGTKKKGQDRKRKKSKRQPPSLTWQTIDRTGNETLIQGLKPPGKPSTRCRTGASAPSSKPWSAHASYNNCYNYGNDRINRDSTEKAALPGEMRTRPNGMAALKRKLRKEILKDGLVRVAGDRVPAACPINGSHYVVVIIRDAHANTTAKDFHCVRLDKSGKWSHRDASGFPRATDDAGRPITDITTAVFDGSPDLVGVYVAKKNNAKIK